MVFPKSGGARIAEWAACAACVWGSNAGSARRSRIQPCLRWTVPGGTKSMSGHIRPPMTSCI